MSSCICYVYIDVEYGRLNPFKSIPHRGLLRSSLQRFDPLATPGSQSCFAPEVNRLVTGIYAGYNGYNIVDTKGMI